MLWHYIKQLKLVFGPGNKHGGQKGQLEDCLEISFHTLQSSLLILTLQVSKCSLVHTIKYWK